MKKVILMFGPPCVGKKTQSKLLAEKLELKYISARDLIKLEMEKATKFGLYVRGFISRGMQIPDDVFIPKMKEVIIEMDKDYNGFVFDDFPRTINQAKLIQKIFRDRETNIEKTFVLMASKGTLLERLRKKVEGGYMGEDSFESKLANYNGATREVIKMFESCTENIDAGGAIDEINEKIMSYF